MKEALKLFEGTHDFTSFVSSEDTRENKTRTIYKTSLSQKGKIIELHFQADGFMKYQVRNMVGLLLAIGNDKKEVEEYMKAMKAEYESKIPHTLSFPPRHLQQTS